MKRSIVLSSFSPAISGLQSMSAHQTLALFCTAEDLFQLRCCSQCLFRQFMPIFVSRGLWTVDQLGKMTTQARGHVRGVLVNRIQASTFQNLPYSITKLHFASNFNQQFGDDVVLPQGLLELKFGEDFNQVLPVLPSQLNRLILGNGFNQFLQKGTLPSCLRELLVGASSKNVFKRSKFNCLLVHGVLPVGLTKLDLGYAFNQSLLLSDQFEGLQSVLPSTLTVLKLSANFNQSLNEVLPPGLTRLQFGNSFSQYRSMVLPTGLCTLSLGSVFNEGLTDCQRHFLPTTLTTLKFGRLFNQPIYAGLLPSGITHLEFGLMFDQSLVSGVLPFALTKLVFDGFNHSLPALPASLTELTFRRKFNLPFGRGTLPAGLLNLHLGFNFNQILENLPTSLKRLNLGGDFALRGFFEVIDNGFNQPIKVGDLPSNLQKLSVGSCFNHSLEDVLPGNLTQLHLGTKFNHKLGALPRSLMEIIREKCQHGPLILKDFVLQREDMQERYYRVRQKRCNKS